MKREMRLTYSGLVVHGENVVDIALDNGGLSCAQVADDQNLVEVLANLGGVWVVVHLVNVCTGKCSMKNVCPKQGWLMSVVNV